ncbi:MAG TPA: hypothetical protein VIT83_05705 [Gammaproteobacteria bacterium]
MTDDRTKTKTLWSETQFEILYSAIQKNGPDREIIEIIKDLKQRGFPPKYLVDKVQDKVGMTSANRLKSIIRDANL